MSGVLAWVSVVLTAIFFVALAVAWWEHLRRSAEDQRRRRLSPQSRHELDDRAEADAARQDLLHPARAAAAVQVQTGDRAERQSALHQALTRMAERPGAAIDPDAWIDTEPQVALGQAQNFAATMPFELDTSTLRH